MNAAQRYLRGELVPSTLLIAACRAFAARVFHVTRQRPQQLHDRWLRKRSRQRAA